MCDLDHMKKLTATPAEKFQLAALAAARGPRRVARSGVVHYKPDLTSQVDFVHGTPVDAVPSDHLAWKVKTCLELFDLSPLRSKSSPLGRHGFDPAHLLGPWLLASMTGAHHASTVARRLQTDSAYRLLSGGHGLSVESLRLFRRSNLLFFNQCVERTIELAFERGHIDLEQTALDSVRLEADASGASIFTLERSKKLVKQLSGKDTSEMTPEQRDRHQARLDKHERAVEYCQEMDVTNYSKTDPLAALMKFPHGGSKPGHRLTTVVAGAAIRFCIAFYLSSKPTDHGLLRPMLDALRGRLHRVGIADDLIVKVAVDAGFRNEDDLSVAHTNTLNIDVALAQQAFVGAGEVGSKGLFGKECFTIKGNEATCPAGTKMQGPHREEGSTVKWLGVGCPTCPLRAQCTTAKARKITHNLATVTLRAELGARMEEPARKAVYSKRGPVVESMYSVLEDAMGFRRVSSRLPATSQSEIVLKILAYNVTRLWAADTAAKEAAAKRAADVSTSQQSADPVKTARLFWLLDTSDWPVSLVDAIVEFTLDLQAPNEPRHTSPAPSDSSSVLGQHTICVGESQDARQPAVAASYSC